MSTYQHHAIIVTSMFDDEIEAAHHKAKAVCLIVTDIHSGVSNGWRSFAVLPDGSKENWGPSDEFDRRRQHFLTWLEEQACVHYAEVSFGELQPTVRAS